MRFARPLVWGLPALLYGAAAQACTTPPGYSPPSNLALARDAETIVVARVVAGHLDESGDPFASTITIHPLTAVKGPLPAGDIAIDGMMLSRDAGAELGVLSNPYEFRDPHPVSYIGGCIRYVFPLGTTALFFLRRGEAGRWIPAGAFGRWAEDVPDAEAPWIQLTRFYVHAGELADADRAALFEAEREALLARTDEPLAQLMAADIARQEGHAAAPVDTSDLERRARNTIDAALEAMRRAGADD